MVLKVDLRPDHVLLGDLLLQRRQPRVERRLRLEDNTTIIARPVAPPYSLRTVLLKVSSLKP